MFGRRVPGRASSASASVGLIAALLVAAPAAAGPLVHELSRSTEVGVEEVCDAEWGVVTTSTTLFMLRGNGEAGAPPKFFFRQSTASVYTDPEDSSRGFAISANDIFADLHITHVAGTIYTFESAESGVQQVVSTLGGRVVARNRGHLTWSFVIDTGGSSNPDDYVVIDSSSGLSAGPHPLDDEDLCDAVAAALGG